MRWLSALMLTLALSSLSPQSGFAQDDYEDYNILEFIIPEGKVLRRTTKTTTTQTRDGKATTGSYTGVYDLHITANDDHYVVTKTLSDHKLDADMTGARPDEKALTENLLNTTLPRKVVYVADESLAPYSIENWEELKTQMITLFEEMKLPNAREAVDMIFGALGPEDGVSLFLKDDAFMSVPHNTGLRLNDPIQASEEAEAPFGGTFVLTESITLTQWSPDTDRAVIEYVSAPEPASLKIYIIQVIKAFMQRAGQTVPDDLEAEAAKMTIHMRTGCRFEVSISTGLVNKGVCEIRSGISTPADNRTKTEIYEMAEEWLP